MFATWRSARRAVFLVLLLTSVLVATATQRSISSDIGAGILRREAESNILGQLLSTYHNDIRPSGSNSTDKDGDPTMVTVNLYVRNIEKIDDVKNEFRVQLTFRQKWNDKRLMFNDEGGKIKFLTTTDLPKVWVPDTFFRNEREGRFHNLLQPNLYLRIFPNGDILHSIRVSLSLSCPMNLAFFPMDYQTCHISVASYSWTTRDMIYAWQETDPVQLGSHLLVPTGFELASYSNESCDVRTATGVYSCISVRMQFKRQLCYYLMTMYLPTFLIVCLSWVSFWLDHKSSPVRLFLIITTILAMYITNSTINTSIPPVAITKAINMWLHICISFVFLTLLEYVLVIYAARQNGEESVKGDADHEIQDKRCGPYARYLASSEKIDMLARIVFPSTYTVLNIAYWSYYLSLAQSTSY